MIGPAIIVIALVVAIPVAVCMTGAVVAWLLGYFIRTDVEKDFEGSEYLELGR